MTFDELKMNFLLQTPDDLSGLIPNRIINCLNDEGFRTVFSALSKTQKELLRLPNMGEKSLAQFIEIINEHGFQAGDTEDFFLENSDFFICSEKKQVKLHYGTFLRVVEKEISPQPTDDPDKIFIDDYKIRIKEFLNPSLGYQMTISASQNPQLKLETDYYLSLLPRHLRAQITPEFARAAFHTMDVEAQLAEPQEQIRLILINAIEAKLG